MDIERLKELRKSLNTENWNAKTMIEVIAIIDGAIARQSAEDKNVPTGEDVAEAIELFEGAIKYRKDQEEEVKKHYGGKLPDFYLDLNRKEALAITALQAYQPTTRKDRTVEEAAISKTETTSAKKIVVDIQLRPMLDELEVDIDDIKAYISKLD